MLFELCRKTFLFFIDAYESRKQERNIGLVKTPSFIINQVCLDAWDFSPLPI